jgi:hypothetical protein
MLKRVFLVVLFVLISVSLSYAQPAQLWKTGQTTSYATGDDGDLERGVAWPSPRFTDNGNGTVTDSLTGLIWLKDANCFGTKTWADALNDANTLNSGECGLSDGSVEGDWRLPNRKELHSLVDYSKFNPALPTGHPFSNVQANYYWSSTTDVYYTGFAWNVHMWDGDVHYGYEDKSYYVWPVRAGLFYNLNILRIGTGTGTVTSVDGGINCGLDCDQVYDRGTVVTLTATPDTGSTFAGWSGDADCSDGSVTMDADKTCTATFTLNQYTLTVTKSGTGTGTITAGANCTLNWSGGAGTCTVNDGTSITLSGSADTGSMWAGWSGGTGSASACSGTGNCSFNMTAASSVTATFNLAASLPDLIVTQVDGPSSGARGERISITYTVKNQGNVTTARHTEIAFYLSTDINITTEDIPLGKGDIPVLAPGASFTGTRWERIRRDILPGNYYYIGAIVDPRNRITEYNEGNNTGYDSTPITISP